MFPALAEDVRAEHPGTTHHVQLRRQLGARRRDRVRRPRRRVRRGEREDDADGDRRLPDRGRPGRSSRRTSSRSRCRRATPGKITGLKDFATASKTIVVCDEGRCPAAPQRRQVFGIAKITPKRGQLRAGRHERADEGGGERRGRGPRLRHRRAGGRATRSRASRSPRRTRRSPPTRSPRSRARRTRRSPTPGSPTCRRTRADLQAAGFLAPRTLDAAGTRSRASRARC